MTTETDRRRPSDVPFFPECRNYLLLPDTWLLAAEDRPFYPPYAAEDDHCHNCLEIGFCLAGRGTLCIERRRLRFAPGALHVIPRGVRHSQRNEGAALTHWRYIAVSEEKLLRETSQRCRQAVRQFLAEACAHGYYTDCCGQPVEGLIQQVFDLKRQYADDALPEMESAVLLLLSTLARRALEDDGRLPALPSARPELRPLEPALQYLAENYEFNIRVSDLARACAMSESYFRKLFARLMGQSPLEYLNRYRIQRSIFLLCNTSESILSVASRTGFPSIATYHRNFRRYAGGETPVEWRRRHGSR